MIEDPQIDALMTISHGWHSLKRRRMPKRMKLSEHHQCDKAIYLSESSSVRTRGQ